MERIIVEHMVFNFNLQSAHSQGDVNGIARLINATLLKAANANDEALRGAEAQKDLVNAQKSVRQRERALEMLRQLEANAARTKDVLEHVKAVDKYFQAQSCK